MTQVEREFYCSRLLSVIHLKLSKQILDWNLTWKRENSKLVLYLQVKPLVPVSIEGHFDFKVP